MRSAIRDWGTERQLIDTQAIGATTIGAVCAIALFSLTGSRTAAISIIPAVSIMLILANDRKVVGDTLTATGNATQTIGGIAAVGFLAYKAGKIACDAASSIASKVSIHN